MMKGKKFISPGGWFAIVYPSDWSEFEDGEGSFLFYNPDVWTGNFRISAYRGKPGYGREAVRQELKASGSASAVRVGGLSVLTAKRRFRKKALVTRPICGLRAWEIRLWSALSPCLREGR